MTRTEYSIAAPGLTVRERISRQFAEALAALLPGGRVVFRHGQVVPGRRGTALVWSRWHDAPKQQTRQPCPLCGTPTPGGTPGGTLGGTTGGSGSAGPDRGKRRASSGRGALRPASSTVFAPNGVAPYVFAHEWVHRSPALVVSANGVRVEFDLEALPAAAALGFIADLRGELEVFAAQWKDWVQRAEMDRAGPYPIPPLVYGAPGDGSGRGWDDVPDHGVRDSGDVPGDARGGAGGSEGGV